MASQFDLQNRICRPCNKGSAPLDRQQAESRLAELESGWQLTDADNGISKDFTFDNFHQTMAFINALAWIAHQQDHHPDFEAGYNHCRVCFSTHAIGGLSDNDFICAAKIDALQPSSSDSLK